MLALIPGPMMMMMMMSPKRRYSCGLALELPEVSGGRVRDRCWQSVLKSFALYSISVDAFWITPIVSLRVSSLRKATTWVNQVGERESRRAEAVLRAATKDDHHGGGGESGNRTVNPFPVGYKSTNADNNPRFWRSTSHLEFAVLDDMTVGFKMFLMARDQTLTKTISYDMNLCKTGAWLGRRKAGRKEWIICYKLIRKNK